MGRLITNWILVLMGIAAIAIALIDVAALVFHWNELLSAEHKISILLLSMGALLLFLFQSRDDSKDAKDKLELVLSAVGARKIRTFGTRDEWLSVMTENDSKADSVSTQHFSEPPSILGGKSDEYFTRTNARIKNNPNHVYRRAASTGGAEKVLWFFDTIHDLYECDNFSLAVSAISHRSLPLNCFSISKMGPTYVTFVFSSVPLTGAVSAFMIEDRDIGLIALASFDEMWHRCCKLKEGRSINWPELTKLAEEFELESSEVYRRLLSRKPTHA